MRDERELPDWARHPTFANNLVAWRRLRGLTQQEVGELAGFSKGNVSEWESGKRLPDYEGAARLARALKIPTPYLWDHLAALPVEPAPERRKPKRKI